MADERRLALLAQSPIDVDALHLPEGGPEDIPENQSPPRSRIQLFKTGRFTHPRSGKFAVTREVLDAFQQNFARGIPNDRLPMDFDHAPEFKGDTRACGWIVALDRPSAEELWATVEWTWQGAYSIQEREYRYISAAFWRNFTRDDESKVGPTLVGGALTNRPFLEGMAAVTLSRDALDGKSDAELIDLATGAEAGDDMRSDSRAAMSEFALTAAVAEKLGIDADADEAATLAKLEELTAAPEDGVQVVLSGEVKTFASLDEAAKAEGKALVAEGDVTAAQTLDAEVKELKKTVADGEFEAAWTAALSNEDGPKVAPAEKDDFRALFSENRAAFDKTLELRQPIANAKAKGGSGDDPKADDAKGEYSLGGDYEVDEESLALQRRIEAYAKDNDVSLDEATEAVLAEAV